MAFPKGKPYPNKGKTYEQIYVQAVTQKLTIIEKTG